MAATQVYIWQKLPILRLLIPLSVGIFVQWYTPFSTVLLLSLGLASVLVLVGYFFLPLKNRFNFSLINGFSLHLVVAVLGAWLVVKSDVRRDEQWFGKSYKDGDALIVRLLEPPVKKQNSFKVLADVQFIATKKGLKAAAGKLLLYFKKDSNLSMLTYGTQLLINKELQDIKNSGNPGSFNYRQYCLFQGITHQVSGSSHDVVVLPERKLNLLDNYIFQIREKTVAVLQQYISNAKDAGLAEALVIGYKNDLDKDLVQAYSNTGVVHIIAISGLHLGLIYWLLKKTTSRFQRNKKTNVVRVVLIISALWAFSLVAGAQPSVVQSAVMFTCLIAGELFNKKASSINSLLFSAFLLLCYNPFWLWDVGFQLSYSAVLSLIVFYKPIYNWLAPASNIKKWAWGLTAATLAAQIFTLPLVLYHFHQFPLLFLVANLIAVPLSSGILLGELLLLLVSGFQPVAIAVGWVLQQAISLMNAYVERLSSLSYATWNGFSISIIQAGLLYIALGAVAYWLLEQNKKAIWTLLASLSCFIVLRSISFTEAYHQKQMIVYDVPRQQAIDLIEGRSYQFIGDEELIEDNFIRNFHLQPSRVLHRINPTSPEPLKTRSFYFGDKKVVIIDSTMQFLPNERKLPVDVVILSKNPKLYINQLINAFAVKEIVMDGSVPRWKKDLWKKDCDSLHQLYYDVSEKGAFVMRVQ